VEKNFDNIKMNGMYVKKKNDPRVSNSLQEQYITSGVVEAPQTKTG
jgi:hypothetical protein